MPVLLIVLSVSARTGQAQDKPYAHGSESWRKLEGPFRENCSKCHQRLGEPMARQVKEWRGSVHERNGVFCDTCHGGDPLSTVLPVAMGAQNGFMETPHPKDMLVFCGRCHEEELKNLQESLHGLNFIENDFDPSCVTCHNSHNVREVSLDLIALDPVCGKCHTARSIDQGKIHRMKLELTQADQLVKQLYARLDTLPATDPAVPGMRVRLDAAYKQLRALAHFFSEEKIRQKKVGVDKELTKLQGIINFSDTVTR